MKWIAAAGVALIGWLGLTGMAWGANLLPIAPSSYFGSNPSYLTGPPNDRRVFVAERGNGSTNQAQVRIVDNGSPIPTPFLTIGNVDVIGERGLMSIAFAPDYSQSGLFYAFYTARGSDSLDPTGQRGDIRIVEYRVSPSNPNLADSGSARLVLKIAHGASNHNGGWMEFGQDGNLYIAIGDDADPANAQQLGNLLGKILRIDPTDPVGSGSYSIPSDNPFLGTPSARSEIYAYGLRNPYRGSFLPDGRISIGDVGQSDWEEINIGSLRGSNLGWPICEGFCTPANPLYTDPVYAYDHPGADGGCAVVGGHLVEDPALTGLTGRYIYGDYCRSPLRTLNLDVPGRDPQITDLETYGNPLAINQDTPGCSYVLTNTEVFRVAADSSAGSACTMPLPPVDPGDPPDPPPPPPPPVEVTYNSFIPNRALIRRVFAVGARCSISCAANATATVRITRNRFRKRPTVFRLQAPATTLSPDVRQQLRFQLHPKRVRAMRNSIRLGSKVRAFVRVTMRGADGSTGSGSKTVQLVRPRPR